MFIGFFLLAGIAVVLGIIEKIDARLHLNERKGGLVTHGRRVAAMVLNGLGFMNSRLSMTTHFFQDKPVALLDKIKLEKQVLGRFILATNQFDRVVLDNHNILKQYKEQSGVESSFKFIKSSACELDSFYLKTPSRIGALMMVMTLCLMVYNFAQYHMRKCMEESGDVLPNQVGKPVKNPTMRWIAELMNIIAAVTIKTEFGIQRIVTNVKKVHRRIIAYFNIVTAVNYQ